MQGNLEFGQVVLADNLQVGFGEDEGGEKEWVLKGCVRVGFQEFIQEVLTVSRRSRCSGKFTLHLLF